MAARDRQQPVYRFSTEDLPPAERIPYWREVFGRSIVKVEVEPLDEPSYWSRATIRPLPGLVLAEVATAPVRFTRTPALLTDGGDDFVLMLYKTGTAKLSQLGRDATVAAGDAGLMLNGERGHSILDCRCYSLSIPRAMLEPMISRRDAAFTRRISGDTPALRLLQRYVDLVVEDGALATPALGHAVAAHIHDLAALAIGATQDAQEIARGRGVRAARLRAIKQEVLAHLGQRDLGINGVAARHGVSPRYVAMLFEGEGTSFSAFVLAQRLGRAYRLLADPRHAQRKIGVIAFELGFGDLSYFNRAFRRRYGATPSDVRAAGARRARTESG